MIQKTKPAELVFPSKLPNSKLGVIDYGHSPKKKDQEKRGARCAYALFNRVIEEQNQKVQFLENRFDVEFAPKEKFAPKGKYPDNCTVIRFKMPSVEKLPKKLQVGQLKFENLESDEVRLNHSNKGKLNPVESIPVVFRKPHSPPAHSFDSISTTSSTTSSPQSIPVSSPTRKRKRPEAVEEMDTSGDHSSTTSKRPRVVPSNSAISVTDQRFVSPNVPPSVPNVPSVTQSSVPPSVQQSNVPPSLTQSNVPPFVQHSNVPPLVQQSKVLPSVIEFPLESSVPPFVQQSNFPPFVQQSKVPPDALQPSVLAQSSALPSVHNSNSHGPNQENNDSINSTLSNDNSSLHDPNQDDSYFEDEISMKIVSYQQLQEQLQNTQTFNDVIDKIENFVHNLLPDLPEDSDMNYRPPPQDLISSIQQLQ